MRKVTSTPRARRAPDSARPLLYSKTCQYALRTMERVAAAEAERPDAWVPQAVLAKELAVSAPMIAQIVHRLRKARLLTARRGPTGGVGLARPADKITVLEVARAIDGAGLAGRCVLGFDSCTDQAPCPAHPIWSHVRPLLERELENRSLLDLVTTVIEKRKLKRKRAPRTKTTAG